MANESTSGEFAVLLEYGKSRRQVTVSRNRLFEQIQQELRRLDPQISLFQQDGDTGTFILQRWSEKWSTYIDVEVEEDVSDGDKLQVIARPNLAADFPSVRHYLCMPLDVHGMTAVCL